MAAWQAVALNAEEARAGGMGSESGGEPRWKRKRLAAAGGNFIAEHLPCPPRCAASPSAPARQRSNAAVSSPPIAPQA